MKILIFTNHTLDSIGGGSLASIAFINSLTLISNKCFLLYPENNDVLNILNNNVIKIGIKNKSNLFKKVFNIYFGRLNRFYSIYTDTINEINPDIIIFDNSRASSKFFELCNNFNKFKIITIHHNYEMDYYKDSPVNFLIRIPFMYYMKKTEKQAVLNSNINLTLTDDDLCTLKKIYDKNNKSFFYKIGIYEPIINKNVFNYTNKIVTNKIVFIITGNLGATQTLNSLIPFLHFEYNIIKEFFPHSNLIIAGKNPPSNLIHICYKNNIELISNPNNINEIIKRADVYLCPINLGSGIKLRIIDGLKNGLPILSHFKSAKGYENFVSNNYIYTYSNINEFKKSLFKISVINKNIFLQHNIISMYDFEFSFSKGTDRFKNIIDFFT
jgi:hypothetical protein